MTPNIGIIGVKLDEKTSLYADNPLLYILVPTKPIAYVLDNF